MFSIHYKELCTAVTIRQTVFQGTFFFWTIKQQNGLNLPKYPVMV